MCLPITDLCVPAAAMSGAAAAAISQEPPFDELTFSKGVTYDASPTAGAAPGCIQSVRRAWQVGKRHPEAYCVTPCSAISEMHISIMVWVGGVFRIGYTCLTSLPDGLLCLVSATTCTTKAMRLGSKVCSASGVRCHACTCTAE